MGLWQTIKNYLGFSPRNEFEGHTIGPIISLSKEQTDVIHNSREAGQRAVSAYFDYFGNYVVFFTGDGHSFQAPLAWFPKETDPSELSLTANGEALFFGKGEYLLVSNLISAIEHREKMRKELSL